MRRFLPLILVLLQGITGSGQAVFCAAPAPSKGAAIQNAGYDQPRRLSIGEGVALIRQSLEKANFFNILDYKQDEQIWVEGYYAKIDLKDPHRYLGTDDQSKLYSIKVELVPVKAPLGGLTFKVSAKNEGRVGKKYAQTVKAKFEGEFFRRLEGLDKLRAEDPADLASEYLQGENLAGRFGYTALKLAGLEYAEPDTWPNYRKTLAFLKKNCPGQSTCQALAGSVIERDRFWTLLAEAAGSDASVLEEVGFWVRADHARYPEYLALVNAAADFVEPSVENFSLTEFENPDLPEDWKAKGVGSEKARGIEKLVALKTFEMLKRTNAFDVDTEEVLRVRRIAQKLFPYALRKGLDYKIHIYDDSKPGTGMKNNAFTSGGGILYFSRSLLQKLDPQDEPAIAAVVAHELGHNEAYHTQRDCMRENVAQVVVALSKAGDLFVPGVSLVTEQVSSLILRRFSRLDEYEADRLGLYLLYKAGYEPEGMGRVMDALYKLSGDRFTALTDTHPAPPARKKRIHYLITHREALEMTTHANAGEEFDE